MTPKALFREAAAELRDLRYDTYESERSPDGRCDAEVEDYLEHLDRLIAGLMRCAEEIDAMEEAGL